MKKIGHLTALVVFALTMVSITNAAEPVYVNTNGDVISESDIGKYCRPIEALPNGKFMVFSKSDADLALYDRRLEANGVTDASERMQMIVAATSDECERKAGNKCSDGTCKEGTGSCKQKYSGGVASCSCQK